MLRKALVCLVLVVAACGGKKDDGGGGGGKKEKEAKSDDIASLFTGTTVTLPAEVAAAQLGSPEADVKKALSVDSTYVSSKTHDGVSYDLDYTREEKKLEKISVSSRKAELEPILTKQWGPPIKTKKGEAYWFDEKSGMRAFLPEYAKGKRVTFTKYESLPGLLGDKGFDLAFAKDKPLVGATLDELKAAWGGKLCDFEKEGANVKASIEEYRKESLGMWHDKKKDLRLCLALPRGTEQYTPYGDRVTFGRMGKVHEVLFSFPTGGSPELEKQMLAFFDGKYGKPTELTDSSGGKERWYFDPATRRRAIVMYGRGDSVALAVSSYYPIAEMLAADTPGVIAVATKSMPGGTPEQIEKEDPEHFNPHGELQELVYPGTDWSRHETEIDLSNYEGEKTTYAYTVNFHHSNNEAAGDAVMAMLENKLGPAKKAANWTEADQFYELKTKAGKRVEARRTKGVWWLRVNK
jgi:hypothetical protein